MIVRVDKCHSFGLCKKGTMTVQYLPKLYINNILIPPVKVDEQFTYLGRHFDFKMTDSTHKENLLNVINDQFEIIDRLPLHPRNKLLLYQFYTLAKISWDTTVSNISVTWIKNNLENIVSRYVRKWLEIPVSGTLSVATLSKRKFGLGLVLPSTRFTQCQVTFRKSLAKSYNKNIRKIHEVSSKNLNIQYDQYLSTKDALEKIRSMSEKRLINDLPTQSLVIRHIWEYADSKLTNSWTNVLQHLPRNIYSFVIRYMSNTLSNGSNAIKWGMTNNPKCKFCDAIQTLGHVIGGCSSALLDKRYNWRHYSILLFIAKLFRSMSEITVYCDILDFLNPSIVMGERHRPDIVLVNGKRVMLLELTVGFETNLQKNFKRKHDRYKVLVTDLCKKYSVSYVNLSLGAIGVTCAGSNVQKTFSKFGMDLNTINFALKRIANVCIRSTYYIFCMRNKGWNNPELLNW